MSWMDVLILVIFTINVIKGWKNGLILSFFKMSSFIVAGFVAKIYYPNLSQYIMENSTIFLRAQKVIGERVHIAVDDSVAASTMTGNTNIFEILKFPKAIENLFMKSDTMRAYSHQAMEGVYGYLSDILARMFIDFISIIIIFFVIKIVLFIVGHLLDGIATLPVLKQFNCLGGVLFGFLKGLLIVFIFLAVITPFTAMTHSGIFIEGLEKSILAKTLYYNNPIIGILQGAISG
ncbi:CvpA family protein [Crassaminicella profunda]|uniref:CvpA family protein n=1 Tax=Crassaminicella profunda TaxID=1286698 RepID=UPI001CA6A1B7|nr:CvpA family protein [Crassaminicella profunda]QZY55115.1 CvpA family protein [Crassaminicella profunda]